MSKDPDNKELQLFRELLELSSYALGCDGRQFYTQFYGRLMQFMKEEENQKQYPVSTRSRSASGNSTRSLGGGGAIYGRLGNGGRCLVSWGMGNRSDPVGEREGFCCLQTMDASAITTDSTYLAGFFA